MSAVQTVGYGNGNQNRNVFGVAFNQNLSALIKYKAWDNNQTFPTLESTPLETTTNEIFSRNSHASGSCICLVDTSDAAPSQTDWQALIPSDTAESNPNRLKGDSYYVEQDGSILSGGSAGSYDDAKRATFNMVIQVPSTAQTSDDFRFELEAEYSYTGTAPGVKFQHNTGTEGTPTWSDITAGTYGVKHCRASSGPQGSGNFYANIPASSTENTAEAWVLDVTG